jgi:heme exporter protein C
VLWWRTLHQGQSISFAGGSTIAPSILWPLPVAMLGFTLLFGAVVLMRMRRELALQRIEARLRRAASE